MPDLLQPLRESPKKAITTAIFMFVMVVLTIIVFLPSGDNAANAEKKEPEDNTNYKSTSFGSGQVEDKARAGTGEMILTIPKLKNIQKATVPTAPADDIKALDKNAAVHMKGTGLPWQEEANVYLSGHRLGYKNTPSWRAFHDLDQLKSGDLVLLTGPQGKTYTYKVYETLVVNPTRIDVIQPVEGKNIISLQTCTLPDYTQRLIVRAQKVEA